MGWPKKKKDPISERARALQAEIDKLEAQIKKLSAQPEEPHPRLRSTARPHSQTPTPSAPPPSSATAVPHAPGEQIFETLDHKRLQAAPEETTKALYNELGVRKYDLPGAWQRLMQQFRGNTPQHQAFVKLLAAGNIHGLRPLRYEKRVARRRFLILVVVLFAVIWGLLAWVLKHF
jgi:cell division protein FtsB